MTPWLDLLHDHALAWPDGEGVIRLAEAVSRWWTAPLGLGEPLDHYLNSWTISADTLRSLARNLGLPPHGNKRRTISRASEVLGDRARLDALLRHAPEGTVKLLDGFAWDGPVRDVDGGRFVIPGTPEKWSADHGLLYRPSWHVAEMPREVALGLRGPGYHPPFTPEPPEVVTIPIDPEEVDHLMTLAAPHVVERCAALLDNTSKAPLPLLKTGGVGVREVRRVAKETGCDEDETRLLLEICAVARLLAWDESSGGMIPTERFDRWRLDEGSARLRVLLSAWWRMERSSLRKIDGKYGTVLGDDQSGAAVARVRRAVLSVLSHLPSGTAFADRAGLVRNVHWHSPLLDQALLAECASAVLEEARLLGLLANDSLTDLGRALAGLAAKAGDESDDAVPLVEHDPMLMEASTRALASVRRSALFGARPDRGGDGAAVRRAGRAARPGGRAGVAGRGLGVAVHHRERAPRAGPRLRRRRAADGAVRRRRDPAAARISRARRGPQARRGDGDHGGLRGAGLRPGAARRDRRAPAAGQARPAAARAHRAGELGAAERTLAALREHGYSPVPVVDDGGEITIRRTPCRGAAERQAHPAARRPGGRAVGARGDGGVEAMPHNLAEPSPTRTSTPPG